MEYRVWLWGSTGYIVCEDRISVHALVATSTGPVRVEIYQLALMRVDTYGLPGGEPLPKSTNQTIMKNNVIHAKVQ